MKSQNQSFFCMLLACVVTAHLFTYPRNRSRDQSDSRSSWAPGSVRVELATDKKVYKVGEPILINITFRNVGREAFWVSKFIGFARMAGAFDLEVVDDAGHRVPGGIAVPDGLMTYASYKEKELISWIKETRLILAPGDFLGFEQSLQSNGFEMARPGRYELRAIYSDLDLVDLGVSRERADRVKKQIKFPLWFGKAKSPHLWIQIVP